MRTPLLLDGRNLFEPEEAVAAGFAYVGVGRGVANTYPLPVNALPSSAGDGKPDDEVPIRTSDVA